MGAKAGVEHHSVIALRQAKVKVISFVAQGLSIHDAIVKADRKPDVMKDWKKDLKFIKELEKAKETGNQVMDMVTGDAKYKIGFQEFSKEFLESPIFPHHQNWIDILEGREPSWLHDAMTYEKGSAKRLLVNVLLSTLSLQLSL